MSMRVYLDNAAATPVSDDVLAAMQPYFTRNFHNPSALYAEAREAKRALEDARANAARTIGSRPSEVIFTAGGTESTNLTVRGVGEKFPDGEVIISAVEHDAVREPAALYNTKVCPVDERGILRTRELSKMISGDTVLVSVMLANNEIGSVQPVKEVADIVAHERLKRRESGSNRPIYLHTDACQAPLYLDINVARLGVDMMTLNGSKIHGPKQTGILYVRAGVELQPQILGGGQESTLRSGTENVPGAIGFSVALAAAQRQRSERVKNVQQLSHAFSKVLEKKFQATINGHRKKRLPNNVHATFPGCDNERVLFSLDEQGVMAASGSACSGSKDETSHVLRAIGVSDDDARSSLRFSLGVDTTQEDINYVLQVLASALKA